MHGFSDQGGRQGFFSGEGWGGFSDKGGRKACVGGHEVSVARAVARFARERCSRGFPGKGGFQGSFGQVIARLLRSGWSESFAV